MKNQNAIALCTISIVATTILLIATSIIPLTTENTRLYTFIKILDTQIDEVQNQQVQTLILLLESQRKVQWYEDFLNERPPKIIPKRIPQQKITII